MATQVTSSLAQTSAAVRPPNWLALVCGWEFRRFFANRTNWALAGGVFALVAVILVLARDQFIFEIREPGGKVTHFIMPLASAGGMVIIFPFLTVYLGLFLPFFNTDAVSRDVKRRTSELLLTTPLPTWTYLWGRYLYGLALSTGLAALGLLGTLAAGAFERLGQNSSFPWPDPRAALVLWFVIILPPVLLLGSISFALGTLLQRYSNVVKTLTLVIWLASFISLAQLLWGGDRSAWDPTSVVWLNQHIGPLFARAATHGSAAFLRQAIQLPDLHELFLPRLVWIAVGLATVCCVTLCYRRTAR